MRLHRALSVCLSLLVVAAVSAAVRAQEAKPAAPAPAKHPAKPKPKPKPAPRPSAATAAKTTLLGQYGDWGAYTASPGGKKICFVIARPTSAETKPPNRPRNQPYLFITTRPADKVINEISIAVGYPFRASSQATAEIGSTTFALYTQGDGAWIKNMTQEVQMVDAMRSGGTVVVKGESARGTATTDTYSLKGLTEALDRVTQECK
jgi:invasion protein IalB